MTQENKEAKKRCDQKRSKMRKQEQASYRWREQKASKQLENRCQSCFASD